MSWVQRRAREINPVKLLLEDDRVDPENKKKLLYHIVLDSGYIENQAFALVEKYVPHIISIGDILWLPMADFVVSNIIFETKNVYLRESSITNYLLQIYPPSTYDNTMFSHFIYNYKRWITCDDIPKLIAYLNESNVKITQETFMSIVTFYVNTAKLNVILELIDISLSKVENPDLEKCCNTVIAIRWAGGASVEVYEQLLVPFTTRGYVFDGKKLLENTSKTNFESVCSDIAFLEFIGSYIEPEAILHFLLKCLRNQDYNGSYVFNALKYLASKEVSLTVGSYN
jgi:hypothetical protein